MNKKDNDYYTWGEYLKNPESFNNPELRSIFGINPILIDELLNEISNVGDSVNYNLSNIISKDTNT